MIHGFVWALSAFSLFCCVHVCAEMHAWLCVADFFLFYGWIVSLFHTKIHIYNPNTWELQAGRQGDQEFNAIFSYKQDQGQSRLHGILPQLCHPTTPAKGELHHIKYTCHIFFICALMMIMDLHIHEYSIAVVNLLFLQPAFQLLSSSSFCHYPLQLTGRVHFHCCVVAYWPPRWLCLVHSFCFSDCFPVCLICLSVSLSSPPLWDRFFSPPSPSKNKPINILSSICCMVWCHRGTSCPQGTVYLFLLIIALHVFTAFIRNRIGLSMLLGWYPNYLRYPSHLASLTVNRHISMCLAVEKKISNIIIKFSSIGTT